MEPQKFEPIKTDHLPLRTDTYYETRDGNWVLLEHNSALSTFYKFVVIRSSSEKYIALSYSDKGEHLRGCVGAKDIIGVYGNPRATNNMPKLGRPKGSPVSEAAMAARKDNWTLKVLRGMYTSALHIRHTHEDLLSFQTRAGLGEAVNKLVFKLHPELERLIGPEDVIIINGREWKKDSNWVWYSTKVAKEVKINCV